LLEHTTVVFSPATSIITCPHFDKRLEVMTEIDKKKILNLYKVQRYVINRVLNNKNYRLSFGASREIVISRG
jgi:hypothetical protein